MKIERAKENELKAEAQLVKARTDANGDQCKQKVLAFYETNYVLCEEAYKKYKDVRADKDRPTKTYVEDKDIDKDQFKTLLKHKKIILIITANNIEKSILLWELKKITKNKIKHY